MLLIRTKSYPYCAPQKTSGFKNKTKYRYQNDILFSMHSDNNKFTEILYHKR